MIAITRPPLVDDDDVLSERHMPLPPEEVDELPGKEQIPFEEKYVIASNGVTALTHVMHKYPSKFIPHIPRWAIGRYLGGQQQQRVLDGFCGSGTTLVEAMLHGHHAYGIDIDPIACMITKAKTTPIPAQLLIACRNYVLAQVDARLEPLGTIPNIPNATHWFTPQALNDLSIIYEVIKELPTFVAERIRVDTTLQQASEGYWSEVVLNFFKVVFSAILRRTSNADNRCQKTYVSHTYQKNIMEVRPLFSKTLHEYVERLLAFTAQLPVSDLEVRVAAKGDARSVAHIWPTLSDQPADLIVASPPYIKALDYVNTQLLSYLWLGDDPCIDLPTPTDKNNYKRVYVGSKQVTVTAYNQPLQPTGNPRLDRLVRQIAERDQKHGYIVRQFFVDMETHLRQAHQILADNARYVLVVGDNSVSGIKVETHKIMVDVATREGLFALDGLFCYEIRDHWLRFPRNGRGGKIETDWVIVFRKN